MSLQSLPERMEKSFILGAERDEADKMAFTDAQILASFFDDRILLNSPQISGSSKVVMK